MHMMSYLRTAIAYTIWCKPKGRLKVCVEFRENSLPLLRMKITHEEMRKYGSAIETPSDVTHLPPPQNPTWIFCLFSFFLKIWQWTRSVSRVGIKKYWIDLDYGSLTKMRTLQAQARTGRARIYRWFYGITKLATIYSLPAKVSQSFLRPSSSRSSIGK